MTIRILLLRVALLSCAIVPARAQVITTIAGTDWLFPGDGRPALNVPLSGSIGTDLTIDAAGNLYIADNGNVTLMRIGSDGIVNVLAGNGIQFPSGDGGLAVNAGLLNLLSVALDQQGNVYLGQYDSVRKVTRDGIITTIVGNGDYGFAGDGGPALLARVQGPAGLAVDPSGNLYIADSSNNRIRKVTPDGTIRTIAGGGSTVKDGIRATDFQLNNPTRIALDAAGNLYICDSFGDRVEKMSSAGLISILAGGGSDYADGVPATTAFIIPEAIALDPAGDIYIVDYFSKGIRKIDTRGIISTIAGGAGKQGFAGDGGPALKAVFQFGVNPALALDASGSLYVADDGNGRIRKITPDGNINTIAGNGLFHFSGNGGAATTAAIDLPTRLTGDRSGSLYFTEPFVNRIRRIAPDGTISVFAGNGVFGYSGDGGPATSASLGFPDYLAVAPDGSVVFSDTINCVIRAVKNGIVSTLAGTGNCSFNGDLRSAANSDFHGPRGIDYDLAGDLLIADSDNNRIRGIVATGQYAGSVVTLAGDGTAGYSGDGALAPNAARVNGPIGIRAHGNGVYFCDTGNNVVRYIDFSTFFISTVAGTGKSGFSGDGGLATRAALASPTGLNFDAQGNMYIADQGNSRIRRVDTRGVIATVAGWYGSTDIGDGQPPLEAFLGLPADIFFRTNGDLVFTDLYSNRVREILSVPPSFQVNPAALAFTAPAGSTPVTQELNLSSSISGVSWKASTGPSKWIAAGVSAGRTPATLRITADPSALAAGSYAETITITAPFANPSTIPVPVRFTVTAAGQPSLSVSPGSLTFPFVQGSTARNRPLSVSNTGGGSIAFTATASTRAGGSWLQVSPPNATIGAYGSAPVNITANPANLGPGTYSGTVVLASANPSQSIVVPVTMTITSVLQTILIPQTGLSFFAVKNGGPPPPQNIDILNTGSGQMPWTASATTTSGGSWLSVFPSAGETDAASPIVPQVRVAINPQSLDAGTYYGSVQVSSGGASNNPQMVSVILTVLPAGTNLGPIIQPAGILITDVAGSQAPGSQALTIQSTSSTPVDFTTGRVTSSGGDWFQVLPQSGTVSPLQPARLVIQPMTADLAPGIYRGSLTLSFSDGNTRNASLLLVVVPAAASLPAPAARPNAQSSCTPTALAPIFTGIAEGSSIPAGYPGQIQVRVVDDCANPMTAGGVTATFSNGDPPLRLISVKDGVWNGTWVPRRVSSEITVTATAAVPEQNLKGEAQIKIGTRSGDTLPVIDTDGVVNAASFVGSAPLAPGSLIAVFGNQLSQGQASATDLPLPTTLATSTLLVGGRQAPLLFASNGQVNAMVPFGIPPNTSQQAVATRGNTLSVPQPFTIAPAAPGVFTLDGRQGIVVDVDPSSGAQFLVDKGHPARTGHALVIYCTGLGEVDPPVTTGSPAPTGTLSHTINPVTVIIGGAMADVQFAGLTPTQVGLYQVNVVIPSGITSGTEVPLVLTAAGQPSAPVTISVQ
jgi:uncharacterized protein (TIGR03437 family)